eukprot:GHRQ01034842.1.p1 GENE.GHRQ01034842.1~~GHRQ01034842.1.p1  ORF type:complete len:187 (+),score=22.58 GHRQ01034842.1:72-632(+)
MASCIITSPASASTLTSARSSARVAPTLTIASCAPAALAALTSLNALHTMSEEPTTSTRSLDCTADRALHAIQAGGLANTHVIKVTCRQSRVSATGLCGTAALLTDRHGNTVSSLPEGHGAQQVLAMPAPAGLAELVQNSPMQPHVRLTQTDEQPTSPHAPWALSHQRRPRQASAAARHTSCRTPA